mmetsp:Transcript_55870/g.104829  ORF Transcript_55870/g.104829 Transcript_55870/m.104829 type:complete len:469 (-) Transcript_55870:35-1441(-)
MGEARRHRLAGVLEKQSRWRKEWCDRFCILEEDFINYFVKPPAILSDDAAREEVKGRIPLAGLLAEPMEEPGRPYCIRLGRDILSCKTQAEQQKWLQAIRAATRIDGHLQGHRDDAACHDAVPMRVSGAHNMTRSNPPSTGHCNGQEEPELILLDPEGPQKALAWREAVSVRLVPGSAVLVLILDHAMARNGSSSHPQALCRLALQHCQPGSHVFKVESLGRGGAGTCASEITLRVQVLSSSTPQAGKYSASYYSAFGAVCLLAWCYSALFYAVAGLPLVLYWFQSLQRLQHVTFQAEKLVRAEHPSPQAEVIRTDVHQEAPPRYSGQWLLDKSCSEKYEPILKDMGVNYLIRKAADAKTSVLIISKSATHVNFVVKNLVTVEDLLPVDGTWVTKPVPPAGRMRGEMRLRLSKSTENELEMVTEFPPGEGGLRDTLVVDADGNSFSRRVVRIRSDGTELECTRVFRRM